MVIEIRTESSSGSNDCQGAKGSLWKWWKSRVSHYEWETYVCIYACKYLLSCTINIFVLYFKLFLNLRSIFQVYRCETALQDWELWVLWTYKNLWHWGKHRRKFTHLKSTRCGAYYGAQNSLHSKRPRFCAGDSDKKNRQQICNLRCDAKTLLKQSKRIRVKRVMFS